MKTKIISFAAAIACAFTFATSAFADNESGFYEKDHIRGFISFGADFRGMSSEFSNYVNTIAFANGIHMSKPQGDSTGTEQEYGGDLKYAHFNDYYLGFHINIGAQYKKFLTWFDVNFMPAQVSERPSKRYTASTIDGTDAQSFPLYDVKWFCYGADWMFGWKIFGENSVVNLIPAVGLGFNLINFHFASNFDLQDTENEGNYTQLRDRYYSTIASTFNSELEFRLTFSRFSIGLYGGYRFIRYSDLEAEGTRVETYTNDTDNNGDTWFAGARLTWTFRSEWQTKMREKL